MQEVWDSMRGAVMEYYATNKYQIEEGVVWEWWEVPIDGHRYNLSQLNNRPVDIMYQDDIGDFHACTKLDEDSVEEFLAKHNVVLKKEQESELCTDCGINLALTGMPGDTTRYCDVCLTDHMRMHDWSE